MIYINYYIYRKHIINMINYQYDFYLNYILGMIKDVKQDIQIIIREIFNVM